MLMVCMLIIVHSSLLMIVLPMALRMVFTPWCMAGMRLRLRRGDGHRAAGLSVAVFSVHREHP
jgi:hypothetical protein